MGFVDVDSFRYDRLYFIMYVDCIYIGYYVSSENSALLTTVSICRYISQIFTKD